MLELTPAKIVPMVDPVSGPLSGGIGATSIILLGITVHAWAAEFWVVFWRKSLGGAQI